jgi:hypothetical protein
MLYLLRDNGYGELRVVQVQTAQGEAARLRGELHVYDSSAQAYAVLRKLEREAVEAARSERVKGVPRQGSLVGSRTREMVPEGTGASRPNPEAKNRPVFRFRRDR